MRCGMLCGRWGTRSGRVQPWIIGGGGSSSPPSDTKRSIANIGLTATRHPKMCGIANGTANLGIVRSAEHEIALEFDAVEYIAG